MRVGIEGTPLTIPFNCGQRRYLEELILGLARIDKKNHYLIFASKKVVIPQQKNFSLKLISSKFPVFKRQILLPLAASKESLDVFHYPDVLGSIFFKFPKIITTVHDLAPPLSYPKWYKSPKYTFMRIYNSFVRKFVLGFSSALIVDSGSIKKEIISLQNPQIPINTIYLGIGKEFKPMDDKKADYFLTMTDFSPRKNISRVLEAHSLFLKKSTKKINLIIIITTSYPKSFILTKAEKLGIKKYIRFYENVSKKILIKLYNKAFCFIYPSLYEGFGLPILEAMACGCPVITSNYGAMKEVAGNAAYLINPKSPNDIAKAMRKIASDKEVGQKLMNKGLKRVKEFSWEETARKTLKVYKEVYKNG